jgi:hypothetical protein
VYRNCKKYKGGSTMLIDVYNYVMVSNGNKCVYVNVSAFGRSLMDSYGI